MYYLCTHKNAPFVFDLHVIFRECIELKNRYAKIFFIKVGKIDT